MNSLEQLKKYSTVVADTGDISQIALYKPQDATTNPSLILKSIRSNPNSDLVKEAIKYGKNSSLHSEDQVRNVMDKLSVSIGKKILDLIPGRVSTEVPARLSYDTNETIQYAQSLIELYKEEGVDTNRILIKIAATWEGIKAAEELKDEGINSNLTLIFGFEQALACAEAGVQLISPFVGRIYDWHMKNEERTEPFLPEKDPGVASVQRIFQYFKAYGYKTEVMGASFRNVGQIKALAGCDLLTISPELLQDLTSSYALVRKEIPMENLEVEPKKHVDEIEFRTALAMNPMAYEKLGEGIRKFDQDAQKLEKMIDEKLKESKP
jgi:transaldolase